MKSLQLERFRRLLKEGFWVVLGQVIAILGALVGIRMLTEFMNPTAYGELALWITVATLVNKVILGPLTNGAIRFYAPSVEQGDFGGYLNAVRRLVVLLTGIVIFVALLSAAGLLIAGCMKWIVILAATFIFAIFSGYNSILNGILNAARRRVLAALHQGAEPWARFLVAIGLMVWLGTTSTVAMIGYAVGIILVLWSQYLFFLKIIPEERAAADNGKSWSEKIWKYSWPFAAWGIFSWIQCSSDRWALGFFTTTQDVGKYAALYQLGYYPVSIATGMAMQFFAPIFYQRAGDMSDKRRNADVSTLSWRLTVFALAGTGAVFLAALFFHAQIFRIFVAREYASVSYLLPWMFLAGGMFASGQTMALNLQSQMKTRVMITANIVTALLGAIFNFVGADWYGTAGVVTAGILFSAAYFLWTMVLLKKEEKKSVFLA